MDKVTFVILHYINSNDTIECINSINSNINYNNSSIVIVDNKSPNGSYDILKNMYKGYENIFLIQCEKNLGFANGNNVGYKFAKEKLKSDYIILLNNDTIINQSNFIQKVIALFNEEKYDILGPDILSIKDNKHQNPQRISGLSKIGVIKNVVQFIILFCLNCINLDEIFLRMVRKLKNKDNLSNELWNKDKENIQLHGACLIYSPKFIKENQYALNPNTFMYLEEDILFYKIKSEKRKSLYCSKLQVLHKEDGATDVLFKRSISKRRFIYVNSIKSAKYLFKVMMKGERV